MPPTAYVQTVSLSPAYFHCLRKQSKRADDFFRKSPFENNAVSHENAAKLFGSQFVLNHLFCLRSDQMQMVTCARVQSETDLLAE